MELLYEILFEVYLELMFIVVPEEEAASKRYRYIAICVATVVLAGVLALFVWGGVLIVEQHDGRGWIPIVIASAISVAQIVAGFVLYDRKAKK